MTNDYEDIFNNNLKEVLDTETPKKKFDFDIKKDRTLFIQLILLGIWAILTIIIYFFGFPLFEPFINV
jgi:hypothetical protein